MGEPADKILIVEDSHAIQRALKPALEKICGVEVLMAATYAEAVEIIDAQGSSLFLAILDLALPDAMNGEIVDYAAANGVPNLVFTSSFDRAIRESILSKGAIDYVIKSSRSVDELVRIVRRLQVNRQIRILVVDDSRSARDSIRASLSLHMFQVLIAESGQEVLDRLAQGESVSLVLTDYEMPGMNGVELTAHLRQRFSKEELAIVGISSTRDETLAARFLKSGANDFMRKPLAREEFYCRVLNNIEALEHIRRVEAWTLKLEESEARYRSLFESAPVGIFQSTPHGRFLSANPHLVEMYGYDSAQELIEQVYDIGTQLYVEPTERDQVTRALQTGSIEGMQIRRRRKDGRVIWVSLSMRAVRDASGTVSYYAGFSRDITERILAADNLAMAHAELAQTFESAGNGMRLVDKDFVVRRTNRLMAEMSGVAKNEADGGKCYETFAGSMCHTSECTLQKILGGAERVEGESLKVRPDGQKVPCYVIATPFRDKSGAVAGMVESFQDITLRKQTEAMRDHVDRIIQHDLRTPMHNVLGAVQLLRSDGNLAQEQLKILDILSNSAGTAMEIINGSLEIYRIETGQYDAQLEAIDCIALLQPLVLALLNTRRFPGIRLDILNDGIPVAADTRWQCLGQTNLLRTALQNLIVNALEASAESQTVIVNLCSSDLDCRIEISNKGVVPFEIREKFFEKYVTSGKFKGTGLGTYSAKLMIEALGGTISMRSSDTDNETTVIVTLRKPGQTQNNLDLLS